MKKFSNIVFLFLMIALLVSCSSTNSYSNYADIPGYLTKGQKTMLKNLKQLDKNGFLFELDYTEDYHLDEVLTKIDAKSGRSSLFDIRETISPKSRYVVNPETAGFACSAFATENSEGQRIMGRNYDWTNVESCAFVVKTSPANGYKSVGMADLSFSGVLKANLFSAKGQDFLLDAPFYTVDGLNEKGFAVTVLILEHADMGFADTSRQDLPATLVVRYLLDNADSVDNAVELLNNFDIYSPMKGASFHWLLTDATGKAAVIEVVDGKLNVITSKKDNLSVTNYYLTPGEHEGDVEGVWRKKVMDFELSRYQNPSDEQAMDILRSIKFTNDMDVYSQYREAGKDPSDTANWHWITMWSLVYNLDKLSVNIAIRENYRNVYTVAL